MIRKTRTEDVKTVMEILDGAKISLAKLHISQWQDGYPNEDSIRADVGNGISYVLEDAGEIVATAAISFAPDPTYAIIYDGAWEKDEPYGVIHRIAVKNAAKRKGYAAELLAFAGKLAEERGIFSLRADTHEGNVPMRKFLAKEGFSYRGIIYLEEEHNAETMRAAYEKSLKFMR